MANSFVHIELQTKDVAKAKAFYSALFDWKLEDMPMPDGNGMYTMVNVGEGTGGGMFNNPDPNVPPFWLAYVQVDDVTASTKRATSRQTCAHTSRRRPMSMSGSTTDGCAVSDPCAKGCFPG